MIYVHMRGQQTVTKQQYEISISESTSLLHLKVKSHSRIKQQIQLHLFFTESSHHSNKTFLAVVCYGDNRLFDLIETK